MGSLDWFQVAHLAPCHFGRGAAPTAVSRWYARTYDHKFFTFHLDNPLAFVYNTPMKNNQYDLEATLKSWEVEAMLTKLTGVSRVGAVAEASCVTCKGEAKDFRDDLSVKEYTISGMCQDCQDSIFGI